MGMTDKSLCDSCTNTGCEFQSGIVRTKCAFYMPSQLEPDNCGNYVVQDSTTKNDCAEQNGCISCSLDDGDDCCRKLYEESMQDSTTKNDIRDNRVKNELNRVKDELEPTTKNCESCRYYGSHYEVCNYCYKCSLWTEKELTTKNDLGVDCISRQAVRDTIFAECSGTKLDIDFAKVLLLQRAIKALPSVTPQEPILDKIRAEIAEYGSIMVAYAITKDTKTDKGIEKLVSDVLKQAKKQVLAMIDKYKAESEGEDGEIN